MVYMSCVGMLKHLRKLCLWLIGQLGLFLSRLDLPNLSSSCSIIQPPLGFPSERSVEKLFWSLWAQSLPAGVRASAEQLGGSSPAECLGPQASAVEGKGCGEGNQLHHVWKRYGGWQGLILQHAGRVQAPWVLPVPIQQEPFVLLHG